MQYRQLGSSSLNVSAVCLGSMTWGKQNTQQEAEQQIAIAADAGINFIDTAEMYAVPPSEDTYGATESIIGNWLAKQPEARDKWIIASKIAGPGISWIRDGGKMSAQTFQQALDGSLKRLQTDYIDLYQLHWPNRPHPHFARHWPHSGLLSDTNNYDTDDMLAILEAAQQAIQAGKIRYLGLSNETPWGISQYLRLAAAHQLPRIVSLQNEYNLLHHKDCPYVLEQCLAENIGYLAWSPLAGGALTGKYLGGARPPNSRWTLVQRNGLFRDTPQSQAAIAGYAELANAFNITPAQLALAWVNQQVGVASTIIGATSDAQLAENIAAFALEFSDRQREEIATVMQAHPMAF
ncbi:aldo/keto reductase [Bowmanella sp. JS7-9]|uniref:Aldo/keto reductase n=1 Tax=Pseudobowmanella zhangzhouensis TaxID=1537679 RepID=A0ABW1XI97_9ALTE|nr:aldo/keto reductase [Bowmanella sp. JS7-9]TBX21209.1 aldo/keto reductase [Bowmanella sp. JS7-9]